MKLLRSALLVAGLLCALSLAAQGYTRNTSGTTADGTLDALTDLNTAATPGKVITTASTNCSVIKAGPGTLFSLAATSANATTPNVVRLYDLATTPGPTTATPTHILQIPALTTGGVLPNVVPAIGEAYATGIAICVTGAATATDNTSAVVGSVINYSYK